MILIEVVELIVEVDGSGNGLIHCEAHGAGASNGARVVVPDWDLLDLVTHDVENNAEGQEDQAEHGEGDHGWFEGRDWAPGGEGLLLELRILELLYLFTDLCLFFFCDIHSGISC